MHAQTWTWEFDNRHFITLSVQKPQCKPVCSVFDLFCFRCISREGGAIAHVTSRRWTPDKQVQCVRVRESVCVWERGANVTPFDAECVIFHRPRQPDGSVRYGGTQAREAPPHHRRGCCVPSHRRHCRRRGDAQSTEGQRRFQEYFPAKVQSIQGVSGHMINSPEARDKVFRFRCFPLWADYKSLSTWCKTKVNTAQRLTCIGFAVCTTNWNPEDECFVFFFSSINSRFGEVTKLTELLSHTGA